jgi:Tfp pilus assembly protein PilV
MELSQIRNKYPARRGDGFTLVEVVVSLLIIVLLIGGIGLCFVQSARQAEWSSYSLAAQSLAQQGLEQARAAIWDPQAPTPVDNCTRTNFPSVGTNILDVPINQMTNITYATNFWTIEDVTNNPAYPLKMIKVDCVWAFRVGAFSRVYTNSVATFRAPNQ